MLRTRLLPVVLLLRWASLLVVFGCVAGFSEVRAGELKFKITEGTELPISTAGHAGGIVEGLPVVAGGSRWSGDPKTKRWLHECFVLRSGKWEAGPELSGAVSDAAYGTGPKGLILAGGTDGKQGRREVQQLTRVGDGGKWESLTPLPEPIEACSGLVHEGWMYVCGGLSEGKASNRLWGLDLNDPNAEWKRLASFPGTGRCCAALTAVGEELFLFGGCVYPPYGKILEIYGDVFRYSPQSDGWERVEGLNFPGYAWTARTVGDMQILFAGRVAKVSAVTDELWLLDLKSGEAKVVGNLVTTTCCMPGIQVGQGAVLFPGGEPDTNRNRTARMSIVEIGR